MTRSVMIVYGTRPEAIKIAPLAHAVRDSARLDLRLVSTGQHREMVDQVNAVFGLEPDKDLDVMTHGASVNAIYRRVLEGMESVLENDRPDVLVVQGDTSSASAAALAGFLASVPVVHLEAGLRTGNLRSPFPEEANRRLTAVVADLHLAPTWAARANLEAEGVAPRDIVVTGNTVIDALHWTVAQPPPSGGALDRLPPSDPRRPLILVTAHRRESWGSRMSEAMRGVADVAERNPDVDVVVPMHQNPVVRDAIVEALGTVPNVTLLDPLGYAEFTHLMNRATLVVTDSGGVQEEAPGLGKPVLVMREDTERPEGVDAGTVRLIGTDRERVRTEVERLLHDADAYRSMATAVNPYGDGRAAQRAVASIESLLWGTGRPSEFHAGA